MVLMECRASNFRCLCLDLFLALKSDLDYEYPANAAQGQGLADLMTALRSALDSLQSKKGDSSRYLLTAAVAAGPTNYANYKVAQMNSALDYWNLMVGISTELHCL